MTLSVCIITLNEEANIGRTLASLKEIADEIILVDSGSTDATVAIAESFGAKVFAEPWKGFARQKNSSLEKATCDWILSLDADEEVSPELAASIKKLLKSGATPEFSGYKMNRRNMYFGKWIKRSGYYPDPKLRLVKRGAAEFELRDVHEDMKMPGNWAICMAIFFTTPIRTWKVFLTTRTNIRPWARTWLCASAKWDSAW